MNKERMTAKLTVPANRMQIMATKGMAVEKCVIPVVLFTDILFCLPFVFAELVSWFPGLDFKSIVHLMFLRNLATEKTDSDWQEMCSDYALHWSNNLKGGSFQNTVNRQVRKEQTRFDLSLSMRNILKYVTSLTPPPPSLAPALSVFCFRMSNHSPKRPENVKKKKKKN